MAVLLLALNGCGVAARTGVPDLSAEARPAHGDEKRVLAQALSPLLRVLGAAADDGPTGTRARHDCTIALGIVASGAINAAIGPGGADPCVHFRLVVTEGAVRTLPPGEMMALLAHELAHVRLGHLVPEEPRGGGHLVAPGERRGSPPALIPAPDPTALSFPVFTDTQPMSDGPRRRLTRADESEADRMATGMLSGVGGGVSCLDLAQLLERLAGTGAARAWLSTHPPLVERARRARALCDRGASLPRPGGSLRADAAPPRPEARC